MDQFEITSQISFLASFCETYEINWVGTDAQLASAIWEIREYCRKGPSEFILATSALSSLESKQIYSGKVGRCARSFWLKDFSIDQNYIDELTVMMKIYSTAARCILRD
ncbi:MAG: hypothetical protein WCG75_08460 [Armatimonadota bacterium]